jgi:hypothetical protein
MPKKPENTLKAFPQITPNAIGMPSVNVSQAIFASVAWLFF